MKSAAARRARRPLLALLALYAVSVFLIMLKAGSPGDPMWWALLVPFLAWAVAPLAALAFIIGRQNNAAIITLSMILMGFAVVSGVYVYLTEMFGPGARSTSALVFVALPVYQWAFPVLGLIAAAIGWLAARHRRDAR